MTNYHHASLQPSPHRPLTFGPVATKVVLIVVGAMLLLLYLAQSTESATRQYDVRNLEDTLQDLSHDREQLELEAVRLQALQAIAPPLAPEPAGDQQSSANDAPQPAPDEPALTPAVRINALPTTGTVAAR